MPVPTLHRFNVQEYYRMADVGLLKWGEHDELLNGVVMDPFRISPLRASVIRQIVEPFFHLPKKKPHRFHPQSGAARRIQRIAARRDVALLQAD